MRMLHYINQFFGGIGGEDKAEYPLTVTRGTVGPGRLLADKIGGAGSIVATIVCGDNTAQYSPEHIKEQIAAAIEAHEADVLVAGPAFGSGRYGLACAEAAEAAAFYGIRSVVAMHPENPGVNLCPADVIIIKAGESAMDMLPSMERLAGVLLRLAAGQPLGPEELTYCIKRDIRTNVFAQQNGATRAVDMLLAKIRGESFESEQMPPSFPKVQPAPPIKVPLSKLALISTGGLVPKGNPDRLESSSATKWRSYSIAGRASLTPEDFECIHGGIDVTHINQYPNRLIPLDICSEFRDKGLIGALDDEYYVTVGNLTPVGRAEQFAIEMTAKLREKGVNGVILTSSWGTCNRCGATVCRIIEGAGIPVAMISAIPPVPDMMGVPRIVPGCSVTCVLGNPDFPVSQEKALRRRIVGKAIEALETEVSETTYFHAA